MRGPFIAKTVLLAVFSLLGQQRVSVVMGGAAK